MDDFRWRAGGGATRAESEADRPSRTLGGRLGKDGPAWVVAVEEVEFCNQLMRLGRLSDEESLAASRNVLREGARRFKDGARSVSKRELAGKKWAMSQPHENALNW
jgi:hypothetical protein